MQFARTPVIIKAIGTIRLLLRLHQDGARAQRVHRSSGYVNHFARINIDPVQQLLGAFFRDGLLEGAGGDPRFEPHRYLRSRLGRGHIPALGLSPGLPRSLRLHIIGMHLHRELLVREQKLQQQRKPVGIASRFAHQGPAAFLAQLGKRHARQRSVRHLAVVPRKPGFPDLFVKLVIRINGRKVGRAPRTWIERGLHFQWI